MRRTNQLTDAQLIRYYRLGVKLLNTYQSKRAFDRLFLVVNELDKREGNSRIRVSL